MLNDKNYTLFKQLAGCRQVELKGVLAEYLRQQYGHCDENAEYVYALGNIPVMLVAHLDTVWNTPPDEIFYDREAGVIWSPDGLGADDRAGVMAIIQIIRTGLRPHILFTTNEEIGGFGATAFAKNYRTLSLKYIIELDRAGYNDCVFYDCDNPSFTAYIESYYWETAQGSYTDLVEICPELGVAGVNLSIGYYYEHQKVEHLCVSYFENTVKRVIQMLEDADQAPYFQYIPRRKHMPRLSIAGDFGCMESIIPCCICGEDFYEFEMIPVVEPDGKERYYCCDCAVGIVDFCNCCGHPYKLTMEDEGVCSNCGK